MKLDELANLGEIIGALAVVVSLLYLAIQVRQSSRISRFETHRDLSASIVSVLGDIAGDPELYRIWKIMTETPDEATQDDRERFGMIMHQFFTTFSDAHRFADTDAHLAVRYEKFINRFLKMPAVRGWWSRQGVLYSDPFKSEVDTVLRAIENEASD